jgi:hypothetical protein
MKRIKAMITNGNNKIVTKKKNVRKSDLNKQLISNP